MRARRLRFILILLVSAAPVGQAGSVYKCTQADGSITLSDVACPQDTVTREYKGEATSAHGAKADAYNPYSIMEQVRRIEKREKAERTAAAKEQKRRDQEARAASRKRHSKSVLSYQEAKKKALEATGYHDYDNLSQAQRDRVDAEIEKYRHSPAKSAANPVKHRVKRGKAETINPCTGKSDASDASSCVPAAPDAVVETRADKAVPDH